MTDRCSKSTLLSSASRLIRAHLLDITACYRAGPVYRRQWGGRRKKEAGSLLDGLEIKEFTAVTARSVPTQEKRRMLLSQAFHPKRKPQSSDNVLQPVSTRLMFYREPI